MGGGGREGVGSVATALLRNTRTNAVALSCPGIYWAGGAGQQREDLVVDRSHQWDIHGGNRAAALVRTAVFSAFNVSKNQIVFVNLSLNLWDY